MNDDFDLSPRRVKMLRIAVLLVLLVILSLLLMFGGGAVIEWGNQA